MARLYASIVMACRVVRRLLDILPVKLMTPGHQAGSGSGSSAARTRSGATPGREEERAVVMICGLLLPDSRDDVGELVQLLPVSGARLQSAWGARDG